MKRFRLRLSCVALAVLTAPGFAADKKTPPPLPGVDPHRIVNDSMSFLKEREPEMNETEYALYEKVIPMITAQPEFALRLLEGMVAETDCSAAFEFVLGNVYYEQKRFTEAESRFKKAIEKYPTFIRAWDNLGVLYFTSEQYALAVPCFTKAVILGEAEPRLFGLLAFCLFKSGNPIAAEAAYLQAYALDSNNPDWIEGLLNAYLDTRQYPRAESLLRQLVRLKPREPRFWLLLGNVLMFEDRKLDAIAEFETAGSLGALESDGLMLLGDLYAEQKLYPEAVQTYGKLAQTAPGLGLERMLRYTHALISENALAQAEKILDDVGAKVPDENRPAFMQARAALLRARKAWPEAQAELEKLIEIDPLNGAALLDLGQLYETLGQDSRAVIAYEALTRLSAFRYNASLKLANLHVKAQRYDDARGAVEQALALQWSPALVEFQARIKVLAEQHP